MGDWRLQGLENMAEFVPHDLVGKYRIPRILPEYDLQIPEKFIGYNYARGKDGNERTGVHFFLDDYQFAGVWNNPKQAVDKLKSFAAVMSPDFSTYSDMPFALQLYNHYRKHWCAQYWQINGLTVIPTISWSTPESWDWCFDGEPCGAVVAVSTMGCERDRDAFDLFVAGYQEMLYRLAPSRVLVYGKCFDFMAEDNITVIEPFYKQMKERAKNGRQR